MNSPDSEQKKGRSDLLKLERSVEINIGLSWLEHLRHLAALDTHKANFDVGELFDHIDIIVAGVNLTASVESEYILPFFSNLCRALNRLSTGETKKAIVEFQREPWDFVLRRNGNVLFLSVISIDNEMRIVCLDQPINFTSFAEAVHREAQVILDNIYALVGRSQHPEIVRLLESLAMRPILAPSVGEPDEQFNTSPNTLGVSFPGFSLSVFFEPNTSFFQYQPEIAFDLHTLLVPGEVHFEFEDKSFSLGEHVFVTLSTLLKNCQEWMTLFAESQTFEHNIKAAFNLHLRSEEAGVWEIGTVQNERGKNLHRVDPRSFLESILSMSLSFAQKLESLNPTIVVNQRFSDFVEFTHDLQNYWEDLCEKDFFNDEPESFLESYAGLQPDTLGTETPDFRFDFGKLRAVHPAHQWSFQAEGISFSNIFTTPTTIIVPSQKGVVALALETGKIAWKAVFSGSASPIFQQKNTFLQVRENRLSSFDLVTGGEVQGVDEDRRIFGVHSYGDLNILSTEQGIVGREKKGLGERWFYPIKRKIGTGAVTAGPVYSVLSNGGILHALNPITGEGLWKVKVPGVVVGPPRNYRSRIFIGLQSSYRFKLSCKLAFTGREAWCFEEEGVFGGDLFFRGDQCIFSVEKDGGVEIIGLCLKKQAVSWRILIASPRGYFPSFVFFGSHAIAKSSAETLCFTTDSGEIKWKTVSETTPFPQSNLRLIVARDAFFSYNGRIEIRSLKDGQLIRGFGDTMIDAKYLNVFHPLFIITGERGDRIDQDRLVSFTIQHFLAMVDLPKDA